MSLCPVCLAAFEAFASRGEGRPGVRCPRCQAMDRHRFLAVLLRGLRPEHVDASVVLEVAPTKAVTPLLRKHGGLYVGTDFAPAADGRTVQIVADLCAMPFASGSVDVGCVFHVLEHIPDDAAAIAEIARLLSPRGVALIQVPWRPDAETDEDPSASNDERVRRFGQADHVRYYGRDLPDRLRAGGLSIGLMWPKEVLPPDLVTTFGLGGAAPIWVASAASVPSWDASHLAARLENEACDDWRARAAAGPPGLLARVARRLQRGRGKPLGA